MDNKIKDGDLCYVFWREVENHAHFYAGTRRYSTFTLRYVKYINKKDEPVIKNGAIEAPLLDIIFGVTNERND